MANMIKLGDTSAEMPKYQCHKQVWAFKIQALDGNVITPDDGYAKFELSDEFVAKHKPQVGGYYVVYDDGYTSFSPAAAFESGYTRI